MKNPTEKHIEIYVKDPSRLSDEEREWIELAIKNNEDLKILADWFKKFFKVKEQVKAIKPNPFEIPSEILLCPMELEHKPRNSFVLAAQTLSSSKTEEIKTVKTFISRQHKTLMRVLRNDKQGETEVHLLSEYVSDDDIILLYIQDEEFYLVSDEGGVIKVADDEIPKEKFINWRQCKVHLPAFKLFVTKQSSNEYKIDSEQNLHDSTVLNIEKMESYFNVNLTFKESWIDPKIVVFKTKESKTMCFLKKGKARIPVENFMGQTATIYLYN